jgi:hypothetical protein
VAIVDLRPLPVTAAPARRLPQLLSGLALYGTSMAMQVRATLGLNPWDVFHQGLARHLPLSFGLVTAVTGVVVLLLWLPLRQRPGVGRGDEAGADRSTEHSRLSPPASSLR